MGRFLNHKICVIYLYLQHERMRPESGTAAQGLAEKGREGNGVMVILLFYDYDTHHHHYRQSH